MKYIRMEKSTRQIWVKVVLFIHSFAPDCDNPDVPINGKVTLQSGFTTNGSLATQSCNLGYDLSSGSTTIACLETGKWSDIPVICSKKSKYHSSLDKRMIGQVCRYSIVDYRSLV